MARKGRTVRPTGEKQPTILKKPTWVPHGTHVGTMWEPYGSYWEPCGNHVASMWDPCEKLLWDPIGNHVGTIWDPCGKQMGTMWVPCASHMTKLKYC